MLRPVRWLSLARRRFPLALCSYSSLSPASTFLSLSRVGNNHRWASSDSNAFAADGSSSSISSIPNASVPFDDSSVPFSADAAADALRSGLEAASGTGLSEVLNDISVNAAAVTEAVAFKWYHYGPYCVQEVIANLHDVTGLSWWLAIAASTVFIRAAMAPIAIPQLRSASRLAVVRPEMQKIQAQFKRISRPTQEQVREMQMQNVELFRRYDASPFSGIKWAFVQMPIFVSFYWALRDMGSRYPDMANGGALWFTDLTAADPYYVLPVLSSLSFVLAMELGSEGAQVDTKLKNIFRIVAFLMVPMMASFPQGVFVYWITNSLYAVAQLRFLRLPFCRRLFGILDPNDPTSLHKLELSLRPPKKVMFSNPARSKPK